MRRIQNLTHSNLRLFGGLTPPKIGLDHRPVSMVFYGVESASRTDFLANTSVSPVTVIPMLDHTKFIFGKKNGNGTGFSPTSSPVSIIPSVLYTHISSICQKHSINLATDYAVT